VDRFPLPIVQSKMAKVFMSPGAPRAMKMRATGGYFQCGRVGMIDFSWVSRRSRSDHVRLGQNAGLDG
jgi:hypothetical protein